MIEAQDFGIVLDLDVLGQFVIFVDNLNVFVARRANGPVLVLEYFEHSILKVQPFKLRGAICIVISLDQDHSWISLDDLLRRG